MLAGTSSFSVSCSVRRRFEKGAVFLTRSNCTGRTLLITIPPKVYGVATTPQAAEEDLVGQSASSKSSQKPRILDQAELSWPQDGDHRMALCTMLVIL